MGNCCAKEEDLIPPPPQAPTRDENFQPQARTYTNETESSVANEMIQSQRRLTEQQKKDQAQHFLSFKE